jgi:hypothetical protein
MKIRCENDQIGRKYALQEVVTTPWRECYYALFEVPATPCLGGKLRLATTGSMPVCGEEAV